MGGEEIVFLAVMDDCATNIFCINAVEKTILQSFTATQFRMHFSRNFRVYERIFPQIGALLLYLFEYYVLEPLFYQMFFLAGMEGCETSIIRRKGVRLMM